MIHIIRIRIIRLQYGGSYTRVTASTNSTHRYVDNSQFPDVVVKFKWGCLRGGEKERTFYEVLYVIWPRYSYKFILRKQRLLRFEQSDIVLDVIFSPISYGAILTGVND